MAEFNEVKVSRILNPTSIDLGDFVINPFMGCEFSCLYCYVRSNRVVSRKNKPWGDYVDIRINAPELLEKEIAHKKPGQVLLGSTTECFQPIEKKYRITRRIIEILNRHKVYYVILTRSPEIVEYMDLFKEGFCRMIYFTVNRYDLEFKKMLEAKSPDFGLRDNAVNKLLDENMPVMPYFSPVLPWISDYRDIFLRFPKAKEINFECLNFNLKNIEEIIDNIGYGNAVLKADYRKMLEDSNFYGQTWRNIKNDLAEQAKASGKKYNIYIHNFGDYFKNNYGKI